MPRGDLFPEIGPFETGYLPLSTGSRDVLGASGQSPWLSGAVPAWRARRGRGPGAAAFLRPGITGASSSSTSAAPAARVPGRAGEQHHPGSGRGYRAAARHLGVDRWLLFGGSWGSTLALAYAEAHPERVGGVVLRGIFLGRASEVDWFLHGMRRFSPRSDAASSAIPAGGERGDLLGNYLRRLIDPDPAVHLPAALAWSIFEGTCCTLLPSPETVHAVLAGPDCPRPRADRGVLFRQRICFCRRTGCSPGWTGSAQIPAEIVQGRYDMICPADDGVRARARMAGRAADCGARCRPFGAGARLRRALVAAVERFRVGR